MAERTSACLSSRTLPRRLVIRLVRKPATRPGALLMLAAARRVASFGDWVAVRAVDVIMELEAGDAPIR